MPAPPQAELQETSAGPDLTIVGIGASAGGLEAFSQLLRALPRDPQVALVLVQHLAPQHESALPDLLAAQTTLPVVSAAEGTRVEHNHVYVIPPNAQMELAADGRLHLLPRPADRSRFTPIDHFLASLAECAQDRAVAVILSGTASDGAAGLRDVKAVGGMVLAQDPATAKYDGMPRAAIATGLVEVVLPVEKIAAELARIGHHDSEPLIAAPGAARQRGAGPVEQTGALERIFTLLRAATGVDFRRYKLPTIQRRLRRRMVLGRIERLADYAAFLESRPGEVQALYQDLLIHVTHFFREPQVFEALAKIVPGLAEVHKDGQPLRAWVAGCASGEEAYSLAIVMLESLGPAAERLTIQIFGTDLSEVAIERAREGIYPTSIESDVSPERLRRFFTRHDSGYRVSKTLREICIFARQDLTRDPPFSRLDLLMCRNVLIYFGQELQKRLMTMFHYALRPGGYLILGRAETAVAAPEVFRLSDKQNRIYERKAGTLTPPHPDFDLRPVGAGRLPSPPTDTSRRVQAEAGRLIEERYAPAGVVVDQDLQIVQFRGQTGAFLQPPPGEPTLGLLKMAREGLPHALRTALQEARKSNLAARREGVRVRSDGGWRKVDLEVIPLAAAVAPHFLVLFHESPPGRRGAEPPRQIAARADRGKDAGAVAGLQQELESSREYLQSIIQELEAANEELQSANEEILSSNEELQSTNEELDTAKEELQSTNEEINTVNEELQSRNDELSQVNADFLNLLSTIQIAIVIVTQDLRIRRFTPMAEKVLNLMPGDLGRPIGHIKPDIAVPDLEGIITDVIESMTPVEREVTDGRGAWYSLRVRPYKSLDNRIDGAVLALFDVAGAKRQEEQVRRARDFAEAVVETVRHPLLVLDGTLRVRSANGAFRKVFGLSDEDVRGRLVYELENGSWSAPALRQLLEEVLPKGRQMDGYRVEYDLGNGNRRTMRLNARRIEASEQREALILLAFEDAVDDETAGGAS